MSTKIWRSTKFFFGNENHELANVLQKKAIVHCLWRGKYVRTWYSGSRKRKDQKKNDSKNERNFLDVMMRFYRDDDLWGNEWRSVSSALPAPLKGRKSHYYYYFWSALKRSKHKGTHRLGGSNALVCGQTETLCKCHEPVTCTLKSLYRVGKNLVPMEKEKKKTKTMSWSGEIQRFPFQTHAVVSVKNQISFLGKKEKE